MEQNFVQFRNQRNFRTPRNFDTEQCNSSFLNFEHSESTEKLCQLETPTESCIERKKPLIPRSLNLDTTQPSEHFSGNSNSNLDLFEDDANNEDDKDSTLSEINENDIEAEESVLANHDRSLLSNGVLECSAIVGSSMTDLENEVIRKSLNESATVEASAEDSDSEISKCNRNNEDSKDIKTFLKKYIECMARSDITVSFLFALTNHFSITFFKNSCPCSHFKKPVFSFCLK